MVEVGRRVEDPFKNCCLVTLYAILLSVYVYSSFCREWTNFGVLFIKCFAGIPHFWCLCLLCILICYIQPRYRLIVFVRLRVNQCVFSNL
jgi:hypothetical protein